MEFVGNAVAEQTGLKLELLFVKENDIVAVLHIVSKHVQLHEVGVVQVVYVRGLDVGFHLLSGSIGNLEVEKEFRPRFLKKTVGSLTNLCKCPADL